MKPGEKLAGMITAALKKCGADTVYDLGAGCDIHIQQEAALFLKRLGEPAGLPVLSSCCPSWVSYAETFRPEWLPLMSDAKSPQQKAGSLLKFDSNNLPVKEAASFFTVSVMPCTAKKYEASREEMTHKGVSEIDAVLTIRELFRLLRTNGIDLQSMEAENYDGPFVRSSAAAFKMGYSGGKAEAVALEAFLQAGGKAEAFRFVVPKNISKKKESKAMINGQSYGFAWVSGMAEAVEYIDSLKRDKRTDIHYVEVMACLGGCAGGGGQPIDRHPAKPRNRKKICQEMEKLCYVQSPSQGA